MNVLNILELFNLWQGQFNCSKHRYRPFSNPQPLFPFIGQVSLRKSGNCADSKPRIPHSTYIRNTLRSVFFGHPSLLQASARCARQQSPHSTFVPVKC